MKLMRLAAWVAVFAVIGGIAFSQDMDIRALQAKLAAQEARLNDLQAKMNASGGGGTADNVISIKKNGKVTIGGDLQTRIYADSGKMESKWNQQGQAAYTNSYNGEPGSDPLTMGTRNKIQRTNFRVHNAKIDVKVDVNEYFEAFIKLNLHDTADDGERRARIAEKAYVRWKNVCNSGFSLLVGRNDLVFGGGNEAGSMLTGYYGGTYNELGLANDQTLGEASAWGVPANSGLAVADSRMLFSSNGLIPAHLGWDQGRTTQITPSWKTQDGKFEFELSYMQAVESWDGGTYGWDEDTYRRRESVNNGFGTFSTRVTWKPIEGVMLSASFANLHTDLDDEGLPKWLRQDGKFVTGANAAWATSNARAFNLHASWRPCFFPKLKIWGAWTHDWDAGWIDGLDADMLHAGLSFAFTDKLSAFGIGEYLRHKYDNASALAGAFYKSRAWASYVGLKYNVGYGVSLEAGWRHEKISFKDRLGDKHTKAKNDTVYGRLVFGF